MSTADDPPGQSRFGRLWEAWCDAVMASPSIPHGAKSVAYIIGRCVDNKTGTCWPSQATIADRCNMSVDNVQRSVRRLAEAGFLDVSKKRFGGSNRMTLRFPASGRPHPNSAPEAGIGVLNSAPEAGIGVLNSAPEAGSIPLSGPGQFRSLGRANSLKNSQLNSSPSVPPAHEDSASREEIEGAPVKRTGEPHREFLKRKLAHEHKRREAGQLLDDILRHMRPLHRR
ncbi:helix-turn-helix domain-containing protein [Ancylobacter sp. FA202]|uniref:helix-turn-helix domain-containing protein n=1 Tax=Ancylobacter sp. FA202 TaxID=1111106 RepID=UPI0009D9DE20